MNDLYVVDVCTVYVCAAATVYEALSVKHPTDMSSFEAALKILLMCASSSPRS